MFDLKGLRDAALQQGMKLMSDPRVMKMMASPTVMKWMMQAFALRGTVQNAVEEQTKALAHRFKLATEDEVDSLKSRIRDLESMARSVKANGNGR